MDSFSLMRFFFALLGLLPGLVFAQIGSNLCGEYRVAYQGGGGSGGVQYTSWMAPEIEACKAGAAGFSFENSDTRVTYRATGASGGNCAADITVSALTPPYGGSQVAGSFPYESRAVSCPTESPPEECTKNLRRTLNVTVGWGVISGFTSDGRAIVKGDATGDVSPDFVCYGGCKYVSDGAPEYLVEKTASANGLHRENNNQGYLSMGIKCTASAADKAAFSTDSGKCAGTFGYVNGNPVCMAAGGSSATRPVASKTLSKTDNSGKVVADTGGPGGASQATGPNGEMPGKSSDVAGSPSLATGTTTLSATPSTPATSGTSTTADFCKDNPQSFTCQNSTFGGSCEGGFTCGGDAALCAVAKASWETRCVARSLATDPQDASVTAGQRAVAGEESEHPYKSKTSTDIGSFDKANPWSASCPADVAIGGHGIVQGFSIPLSSYCSVFQMIGNLMVAVTALGAAVFVVRM
jgi:hypothetical protein